MAFNTYQRSANAVIMSIILDFGCHWCWNAHKLVGGATYRQSGFNMGRVVLQEISGEISGEVCFQTIVN
jgi:hypothetical protein